MGQQQMLGRALEAFRKVIAEEFPTLSDDKLRQLSDDFRSRLSSDKSG